MSPTANGDGDRRRHRQGQCRLRHGRTSARRGAGSRATDLIVTTNSGDNSCQNHRRPAARWWPRSHTAKDTDSAASDPSTGTGAGHRRRQRRNHPRRSQTLKAAGSITVGDALEFWRRTAKGKVFVNLVDKNQIVVVDLNARQSPGPLAYAGCSRPTGLAYVAGGRLVSACGNGVAKILSAADGHDIASFKIGEGP